MSGRSLATWFRENARALPWRGDARDPYHVVVSEFMLQQTQVDRVVPRFESFVRRFPDFASLAAAGEDDVLAEWSGLGYYRRARMLHRLAIEVTAAGGDLPRSASALERLPGIGPYTAAAVASLAWGESVPVIDGNTTRVGSRVLALAQDPRAREGRRRIEKWILGLMEGRSPGEINEALMELGATVCKPLEPACGGCPLAAGCAARKAGRQHDYPPPRRRRETVSLVWAAACIVDRDGRWLLKLIEEGPILRGLWLPPLTAVGEGEDPAGAARRMVPLTPEKTKIGHVVRHHITHRKIDVVPYLFAVEQPFEASTSWRWVDPGNPDVPSSSLLAKLVNAVPD